jgi:hypothetical protein
MLTEDEKWYSVSLRLFGDALEPMGIEGLIGLHPETVGLKGQKRKGKEGREYAPYETNAWIYSHVVPDASCFEDQLRVVFALLGSKRTALKALCNTPGIEGDVFLGFSSGNSQGGDTISPEILRLIADTGLSLSLDLYPPTVDEDKNDIHQ